MESPSDIYRNAAFNMETRVKLELAANILLRVKSEAWADPEIDLAGAIAACRDAGAAWDSAWDSDDDA